MERMKFITIFSLLSRAIFTAMVFIFIDEKGDFILQPVFMSLGYLLCGLAAMYLIVVKWKVRIQAPRWPTVISTIKKSTDVFINNLMPNLYNSFSTVLLGFLGGSTSTGLLDAGRKFVEIAQSFLVVVSRVFFPFLSRRIDKHDLYVMLHFGLAITFSIIISIAAPWIINLFYTPEFDSAVLVLQVMSLSIVFMSLSNIYGTNYLLLKGHEKALRNITAMTSVVGFLLAFPFIYYFDYIGAAIIITFTRAMLGLIIMNKAKSFKKKAAFDF